MANPTGKTDKQTPGVYRRRIGDALVTTINDGFLDISFEILRGAEPRGPARADAQRIPRRAAAADGQRLCHRDRPQYDSCRFGRRLDHRLFHGPSPRQSARRGLQARRLRYGARDPHPSRPHERPSGYGGEAGFPARGSDRARGRDRVLVGQDPSRRPVGRGDALSRFRRPGPRSLSRKVPSEPGRNCRPRRDATAASWPYPGA